MRQGLCNDTVSVRPSVCPSQLSTAGLLLSAVRAIAAGAYQQQQRCRSTGCSTALRSKLRAASRLQRTSEAEHGQSQIKSQLGLMLPRWRHVDSAKRRARLGSIRPGSIRIIVLLSLNLYHLLSNQRAWNIFPRASRYTIHFRTVTPRSAEVWAYDSSWV